MPPFERVKTRDLMGLKAMQNRQDKVTSGFTGNQTQQPDPIGQVNQTGGPDMTSVIPGKWGESLNKLVPVAQGVVNMFPGNDTARDVAQGMNTVGMLGGVFRQQQHQREVMEAMKHYGLSNTTGWRYNPQLEQSYNALLKADLENYIRVGGDLEFGGDPELEKRLSQILQVNLKEIREMGDRKYAELQEQRGQEGGRPDEMKMQNRMQALGTNVPAKMRGKFSEEIGATRKLKEGRKYQEGLAAKKAEDSKAQGLLEASEAEAQRLKERGEDISDDERKRILDMKDFADKEAIKAQYPTPERGVLEDSELESLYKMIPLTEGETEPSIRGIQEMTASGALDEKQSLQLILYMQKRKGQQADAGTYRGQTSTSTTVPPRGVGADPLGIR